MAEGVGDGLQNQDGLFGDFRADAIAGEDGEVQEHGGDLMMEKSCNGVTAVVRQQWLIQISNYSITKLPDYPIAYTPQR